MFKLFGSKQRSLLGIDISSASIKAVEISCYGNKPIVEGYGSILIPEHAMEGTTIKDEALVAKTIQNLISENKFKSTLASIAVPDSLTISRTIQVHDELNDNEIEELVIMEADKYIPYPINEINIDFTTMGTNAKNTAMKDVLLVASKSENVNKRTEVLKLAGLQTEVVDVESYAIERCAKLIAPHLHENAENKIIAIVDIGAYFTHFFVLSGMKILFTREEEFGGFRMVQNIAEKYGYTEKEAETALLKGNLPSDVQEVIFQPFRESIMLQIKRGLQVFFSSSQHTTVDYLLLAGGVSKLPDFATLVQEHINITTALANPFKYLDIKKGINAEKLYQDAPSYLIACGLALRVSDRE